MFVDGRHCRQRLPQDHQFTSWTTTFADPALSTTTLKGVPMDRKEFLKKAAIAAIGAPMALSMLTPQKAKACS